MQLLVVRIVEKHSLSICASRGPELVSSKILFMCNPGPEPSKMEFRKVSGGLAPEDLFPSRDTRADQSIRSVHKTAAGDLDAACYRAAEEKKT